MINTIQPYPEVTSKIDGNCSSLHAAAGTGNWKKLKILVNSLNIRYIQERDHAKYENTDKNGTKQA
jgi:hypothetical protein